MRRAVLTATPTPAGLSTWRAEPCQAVMDDMLQAHPTFRVNTCHTSSPPRCAVGPATASSDPSQAKREKGEGPEWSGWKRGVFVLFLPHHSEAACPCTGHGNPCRFFYEQGYLGESMEQNLPLRRQPCG